MRKSLLALVCMALSSAAFAVSITWEWDDSMATGWGATSSYYMVYSQADLTTEQVVVAANKNYGTSATGTVYGSGWGAWNPEAGTIDTNVKYSTVSGGWGYVEEVGGQNLATVNVNGSFSGTYNPDNSQSGFLYLVVFNDTDATKATQFAVAQAGTSAVVVKDTGVVVNPGVDPNPVEFIDPTWKGGTYKAAPEPTALALLALGVAGAALRRRIR